MKNAIYLFLTMVILSSCEMVVDLDIPDHEPKLVINGYFEQEQPWKIHVSHSVHVLERNKPDIVQNATVKIFEDGILLETLQYDSWGYYIGNTFPVFGRNYSLEVSAPGYQSVTATDRLPELVPIVSVIVRDEILKDEWGDEVAEVRIKINDPAGVKNFYQFQLKRKRFEVWWSGPGSREDTIWYESVYFYTADETFDYGGGIFSDRLFDGKTYEIVARVYIGDLMYDEDTDNLLRVHLNSFNKTYYDYLTSANQQNWNHGDPFSEPIQVRSNVIGGYGIFAGKSSSVFVFEIEE